MTTTNKGTFHLPAMLVRLLGLHSGPTGVHMNDVFARLGDFFEEAKYVPQGAAVPEGFTHTLKFASTISGQDVVLAVKVKAEYASILDLILSFV